MRHFSALVSLAAAALPIAVHASLAPMPGLKYRQEEASLSSVSESPSATTSGTVSATLTSEVATTTQDSDGASESQLQTTGTPLPSPPALLKPDGGIGFNDTPTYKAKSDFDRESLYLGLHQELIELDLFRFALQNFSREDFNASGLGDDDLYLLDFMAQQEVGHATLISSMIDLNTTAPYNCTYSYPFTTVREFIDFSRLVTRYGESGTIGFLGHMDAQDSASLINDAIQTEGRQQLIFRQWEGLFPMPFWFTTSITQSMQWTLLAPYIATCPADTPPVKWTAFPKLNILNNPSLLELNQTSDVSSNETAVTAEGREISLSWDAPGQATGWNSSFTTASLATGAPQWVAWISQLNTTYTPLTDVDGNTGKTLQPGGGVYGNDTAPLLNGTVYVAITDADVYVTPYNLSQIESHIIAGPALYNVG